MVIGLFCFISLMSCVPDIATEPPGPLPPQYALLTVTNGTYDEVFFTVDAINSVGPGPTISGSYVLGADCQLSYGAQTAMMAEVCTNVLQTVISAGGKLLQGPTVNADVTIGGASVVF